MLPNFFIVGTPKSGTTSLFNYLNGHSDIFMCPKKEPNYFSFDEIEAQKLYYPEKNIGSLENYKALFKKVSNEKVIGEASVSYLFYKKTPEKIKRLTPDSKIIIILRNPVDRAFSHFLMDQRLGLVNISFDDIVFKKVNHPMIDLYYQQFIELCYYYNQVKRYFDCFGKNKVKLLLTEDLKTDLRKVLLDVYNFLEVEDKSLPNLDKKHNVYRKPKNRVVKNLYSSKKIRAFAKKIIPDQLVSTVKNYALVQGKKPELTNNIRDHLNILFHKDILSTSELIQRDLTSWLH